VLTARNQIIRYGRAVLPKREPRYAINLNNKTKPGPVEGARLARAARRPRTARCTVATPIARPDQRTGHTPRHAFSFRFPHVGRTHDTALRS
jgi:hypothetical protein